MHAVDDEVIPIALAEKLRDSALSAKRDVTFVAFAAGRGLLHKSINQAQELPTVLRSAFHSMKVDLIGRFSG